MTDVAPNVCEMVKSVLLKAFNLFSLLILVTNSLTGIKKPVASRRVLHYELHDLFEYSLLASAELMLSKATDMITTDTNEIIHFMTKS